MKRPMFVIALIALSGILCGLEETDRMLKAAAVFLHCAVLLWFLRKRRGLNHGISAFFELRIKRGRGAKAGQAEFLPVQEKDGRSGARGQQEYSRQVCRRQGYELQEYAPQECEQRGNGSSGRKKTGAVIALYLLIFLSGILRAGAEVRRFSAPEARAFFEAHAATNEGEFDYGLYLKGEGICSEAALELYRGKQGKQNASLPREVQRIAGEILDRNLSEHDAGIYRAMLLGDKQDMDQDVKALYQAAGIAHLLAVSGLHVSMFGMGVYEMLRKLRFGTGAAGILAGAFVVFYGCVTGASGSAVRAVWMLLLRFLAVWAGRSFDMMSALSFAAVYLGFCRPYLLLQSGFQLSFGAVFAICALAEPMTRRIEKLYGTRMQNESPEKQEKSKGSGKQFLFEKKGALRPFPKTVIVNLSIQFVTLPIVLYHYFTVPLYGVILNFAVIPLMSLVMGSGILILIQGALWECLFGKSGALFLLGALGHYILAGYEALCRISLQLPHSTLCFGRPALSGILCYYLLLLALYRMLFGKTGDDAAGWGLRRGLRRCAPLRARQKDVLGQGCAREETRRKWLHPEHAWLRALCFFVVLLGGSLLLRAPKPRALRVTMIDVGQGDGCLIEYQGGSILLDAGSSTNRRLGERVLEPLLLSKGIRQLDAVLVSHADTDHISGILYLMEESAVQMKALFLPEAARTHAGYDALKTGFCAQSANGKIQYLACGDGINTEDGFQLACIYSGQGAESDVNSHSPVLLLRFRGFSMLFTGDTTAADEKKLSNSEIWALPELAALQKDGVTVYKAAHHGSKTSNSDFILKRVHPRYALLSYGANNRYGHPHEEVVARLLRYHSELICTAETGAVVFETDGNRLVIRAKKGYH